MARSTQRSRRLRWKALASTVALSGALLATSSARGNPPDTYGFASRETAMGNAAAAETRGYAAGYYNPAALVRSRGLELAIGYFRAQHALEIDGRDNAVDPVKGLNGGLVLPGRIFGVRAAFGLAVHVPDDRLSRVRALRQEQPRWELYDNRNQRLYLAANLAFEPFSWLAIGGGLSFMSSTRGQLDISGSANVVRPDDSQIRHEVDADLTAVRYPQAGALVTLSDRASLALVYRGQFQLGLDLGARLTGDITGLTTALYDLRTRSVNNFLPQQIVLGGAWRFGDTLRTTLDFTWIDWSAYVAPVADLDVVLDIPPPPGGWPSNISPPQTPTKAKIEPLHMQDRVVPHIGAEWRAFRNARFDAFVRGGYELARSPLPPQVGITNYVDRDRHTISLGFGTVLRTPLRELPGSISLDVHAAVSILPEETTRKASAADFVGDYRAGGTILNVGATLGIAFDRSDEESRR